MTDVVNPKSSSPDQLLPYHKKISAEDNLDWEKEADMDAALDFADSF